MKDIPFNFSGEGQDFLKEVAEDIVQALGGTLGEENSVTMSLDEDGGTNAVNRNWLFDMLSLNMCLNTDMYINESFSANSGWCYRWSVSLFMSIDECYSSQFSGLISQDLTYCIIIGTRLGTGTLVVIHLLIVAKISKLLLEMENGNMSKNKGKSLDEIQFNREEPLEDENSFEEGVDENETATLSVDKTRYNIERLSSSSRVTFCNDKKAKSMKKNVCKRKKCVLKRKGQLYISSLAIFVQLDRLPGKHVVVEAQRKEPILGKRPWKQIVFFIKNHKASAKKSPKQ